MFASFDQITFLTRKKWASLLVAGPLLFSSCANPDNRNIGESEEINQQPTIAEADTPIPDTIHLEAKDFVFLPPKVILPPARQVVFMIQNNGDNDHNIYFQLGDGIELETDIPPGEAATLELTTPDEPGDYVFYCPRENHREMAMEGTLSIQE